MMSENLPPPSHDPRSLPRRRQFTILGIAAAAIVIILIGSSLVRVLFTPKEQPAAAQEPGTFQPTKEQLAGLKVMPVALAAFHSQQSTDGKIATNDETTTPVFSPFSGRVTRLIAKPGDVVQPGQPLFAIQASEFVQAQNDLIAADAGLKTADVQLKLAEATEKRERAVYEARGAALKDLLQSQSDLVNAQGAHRSAEIALAAVRNRLRILGKTEKEIAAIEGAPSNSRMTAETVVTAPIGGTVIQRQVSPGQYIVSEANGASAPVYSIGNLSAVWLVANVREVDAPQMQVDQPVDVTVPAYPGRIFKAHLAYVGSVVDDATRRMTVRAEVENTDGALKPGMFAHFTITTSQNSDAPGVPEMAVVYEGDAAHVWVLLSDGRIALRAVKTGRSLNGLVEILDGLKAGENVVTSGTLFIDRAADGA